MTNTRHREKCGTQAGYSAHMYHHEDPCQPCRDGHHEYQRDWRAARGLTTTTVVPLTLLGELLLAVPNSTRVWAIEQVGQELANRAVRTAVNPPRPRKGKS